jgi:predicted nucleotide-binding protein (sugar kinase/HSP70/actin superfamily)
MTKSEEKAFLRHAVSFLGVNSYSGLWLGSQLPAIESAIDSDIEPECVALSPDHARAQAEKIIAEAKREASEIEARAKREAEKTREAACKFSESIRADLRRSIESALARIDA